jgi:putative ABC transport system permease protein
LRNFAFSIDIEWWIFVLAAIITISLTIVTTSWQSFKAARKNPVESLRYE